MSKMIDREAEVLFNDPPLKRIDPMRPGLKSSIRYEDWDWDAKPSGPDPHLYVWNDMAYEYQLKEHY